MWKQFGMLQNCYTKERKHKVSKRVCTDHLKTKSYEQAVMEEITLVHSQLARLAQTRAIESSRVFKNTSELKSRFASSIGPIFIVLHAGPSEHQTLSENGKWSLHELRQRQPKYATAEKGGPGLVCRALRA